MTLHWNLHTSHHAIMSLMTYDDHLVDGLSDWLAEASPGGLSEVGANPPLERPLSYA